MSTGHRRVDLAPTAWLTVSLAFLACARGGVGEPRGEVPWPRPSTSGSGGESRPVLLERARLSEVPLFPEELETLRRAALAFLQQQRDFGPVSVVPLEELDVQERLAAESRTRPGGPRCLMAPSVWELTRARYPQTLRATLTATCYRRPCQVQLQIVGPPAGVGSSKELVTWEANVDRPESLASWQAAVGRLAVPPPTPPGASGGLLGWSRSEDLFPVRIDRVRASGTWASSPEPDGLAPIAGGLAACHEPGWVSASADRAVLAVTAAGTIGRCNIDPDLGHERPERLACLCRALRAAVFPAGAGDRRLVVNLMNTTGSKVRAGSLEVGARFDAVVARDGSALSRGLEGRSLPLATCYAASPGAATVGFTKLSTHLEVNPAGRVTAIGLGGLRPDASGLGRCIEEVLRSSELPCTASGAPTTVDATLVLYAHAPM